MIDPLPDFADTSNEAGDRGPGVRLNARCNCSQRRGIPVRGVLHGIDTVRAMLNRRLNPDLVVLSYRCADCKQVVYMTLRDLHLAS